MKKVKAISSKGDTVLGEIVFEDFTPFEAALVIQHEFSMRGMDSEVVGLGIKEDDQYMVNISYTGIVVKVEAER